jgi:hypothetical protein
MPKIGTIGGWRIVIYPNDHRPAHVHLINQGTAEAVFKLNCPDGPPELRENFGFSGPELTVIRDELMAHLVTHCTAWSVIHGPF